LQGEEFGVAPAAPVNASTRKYGSEYSEALHANEQVIACDPNLGLAWRNKGDVLKALNRPAEAEQAYKRVRELDYTG
jgi:tetratricopeptide (TPR) repeat protein